MIISRPCACARERERERTERVDTKKKRIYFLLIAVAACKFRLCELPKLT